MPSLGLLEPWESVLTLWADNLFLVGSDSADLQRRLADVQETFATRGLASSDSSLEVLRTLEADSTPLSLPPAIDQPLPTNSMSWGCSGSTSKMVAHRLREAARTWFKLRTALMDAGIPRGEGVCRFYQTVGARCLWDARAWVSGRPSARTGRG